MATNIQVVIVCVVMWSDTIFPEHCAPSIFSLKMEAAWPCETLIYYHITTRRHKAEVHDLEKFCMSIQ
jgi:hypothetical protein